MSELGEQTFHRALWKHFGRWLLFIFSIGLNIAMPMSLAERLYKHVPVQVGPEVVQFLFLLACDMYLLPTAVLELNTVAVGADDLTIACLLWKSKLQRKDIVSFTVPRMLALGLLRTPRCFYLINRADFANFDELASLIEQRLLNGPSP